MQCRVLDSNPKKGTAITSESPNPVVKGAAKKCGAPSFTLIILKRFFAAAVVLLAPCMAFASPPADVCKGADSGSYLAIARCGDSRFAKSDAELNAVYKQLKVALRDDPPRRKLLIDSQRAWLAYREKSCEFWHGVVSYEVGGCKAAITNNRIEELKHMHGCYVEGGNEC